ncbi:MAG: YggT family protein [Rhodospirillales bacterium]|nr:YggT family protein [Rhodospirillales bacterium]
MSDSAFFLNYLPFWVVNYGLAIVLWSCLGRFLLAFFVPSMQPTNYIWRCFVALTDWAVRATAVVTPSFVPALLLPPIAAFWIFHLRLVAFLVMWRWGLVPPVAAG